MFSIVFAVRKLQSYLFGRELLVEAENEPLMSIIKDKTVNQELMRWTLSLQSNRHHVWILKVKDNVMHLADYLSGHC